MPSTTIAAGQELVATVENCLVPKKRHEIESVVGGIQAPEIGRTFELGVPLAVSKVSIHLCKRCTTLGIQQVEYLLLQLEWKMCEPVSGLCEFSAYRDPVFEVVKVDGRRSRLPDIALASENQSFGLGNDREL